MFHAVGVDVGGTKIAAGVVGFPGGEVVSRKIIPTRAQRGGEEVLEDVEQLIHEVAAQAGQRVGALGVGVCEIVSKSGELASECCLRWGSLRVQDRLRRIAPVVVEADVRAAATAEALFGRGRNTDAFLYVTIGTGISSCLVVGGEPYRGARGAPGTMASGLVPVFNAEPGLSLEQIASGPGLVERFRASGGQADSGQQVLAAAAAGDSSAREVVQSGARLLGGTIGWMVNILDPELVVLGGGLGLSEGVFREPLVAAVRQHVWWEGHRSIPIVSAVTGADAGIIGAAAVAWRGTKASSFV